MTPVSPWRGPAVDISRPRPFDSEFPRADNTFVMTSSSAPTSAWEKPIEQRPAADPWGIGNQSTQMSQEPQSLTTANVNQHNERQQTLAKKEPEPAVVESKAPEPSTVIAKAEQLAPVIEQATPKTSPTSPKGKRKTTTKNVVVEQPQPPAPVPAVKLPQPAPQKAPWATEDDAKPKATHPLNLREIQEMEMKMKRKGKRTTTGQ